jgi:putative tricarboxylic transport membrane protein
MRRDTFIKSLAALAAAGALPKAAFAAGANVKMMIPANPGGGWDGTGRALGEALRDAKVADSVTFENKGGAAGAIGLAQFYNSAKGDPNALMVMGAVMLGGIITGKPPVSISQVTPIARLTTEYNVFVLPANSPFNTMKDVVEALKKDGQHQVGRWFARFHRAHRGFADCPGRGCARRQDQLRAVPRRW